MLLVYLIISFFIAWIWVDYFRLIDIFNKDSLMKLVLVFFGGAASTVLIFLFQKIPIPHQWMIINGDAIHDLLYCIIGIGLVEELTKILPVILAIRFFRLKALEPIDLLAFYCVSALGFSSVENTIYYYQHGPNIITDRAVLSTVTHMFCTGIFGYGIIRYKYHYYKSKFSIVLQYLSFASISHGIYDFICFYEQTLFFNILFYTYFLLTISIFATIINNAINNSAYFNYKSIINSGKVISRMLLYYGLIFLAEFSITAMKFNGFTALIQLFVNILNPGLILLVIIVRLSRFKLIRNRWHPIRFELPVTYVSGPRLPGDTRQKYLRIKGDSYDESLINAYYNEYFILVPLRQESSFLEEARAAYIEEKLFLKGDETFYLTSIFADIENKIAMSYLIKPKNFGISFIEGKYPIVALLRYDHHTFDMNDNSKSLDDFEFIEWAYIKPQQYFR